MVGHAIYDTYGPSATVKREDIKHFFSVVQSDRLIKLFPSIWVNDFTKLIGHVWRIPRFQKTTLFWTCWFMEDAVFDANFISKSGSSGLLRTPPACREPQIFDDWWMQLFISQRYSEHACPTSFTEKFQHQSIELIRKLLVDVVLALLFGCLPVLNKRKQKVWVANKKTY